MITSTKSLEFVFAQLKLYGAKQQEAPPRRPDLATPRLTKQQLRVSKERRRRRALQERLAS